MSEQNVQRLPAEELYGRELEALIAAEGDPVPTGWRMSPRSVLTYITGGVTVKGVAITPKYMGNRRLVEIAIATLVTDRALLLIGEPGTAKSWLSEHLAAAVNGDSTKVIQGTAGTTEEPLFLELCHADCKRPQPGGHGEKPGLSGYGDRFHRPGGGNFPLCQRGAGCSDLHFVRKAAECA